MSKRKPFELSPRKIDDLKFHLIQLSRQYAPDETGPYEIYALADFFKSKGFANILFDWMVGAVAKLFEGTPNPMIILTGNQGIGKTHFVKWLCPLFGYYTDEVIIPKDRDCHILLADKFIWEVYGLWYPDLEDVEEIRGFLARDAVRIRRPYQKKRSDEIAACSFIGTANSDDLHLYLSDSLTVCRINEINWGYSQDPNVKLWAEAVWHYKNHPGCKLSDWQPDCPPGCYIVQADDGIKVPVKTLIDIPAKQELLKAWHAHTKQSIRALVKWRVQLRIWAENPAELIPDDEFASALDDLAQAGLDEWFDDCPHDLDRLRELMTGQEV